MSVAIDAIAACVAVAAVRAAVDAAAVIQAVVVILRTSILGRTREVRPIISINFYSISCTRSIIHYCCCE